MDGINWVFGDLFDPAALDRALAAARAVIHLVGIIRQNPGRGITFQRLHVEGTQAVLAAARRNGVKRIIHMSALGARADARSEYHLTKYQAEQAVRESGLEWTILQPSMIHGPGGEFMRMEFAWARGKAMPFFFMPYFGSGLLGRWGGGRIQPVYVEEVARAFVEAVDNPRTTGHSYPMGGTEQLTWPQMHRVVAEALLGRRRPVMALPVWYASLLTRIVPPGLLPFNRDQIIMSQEQNICDVSGFVQDFGWTPEGFSTSLARYVRGSDDPPADRSGPA